MARKGRPPKKQKFKPTKPVALPTFDDLVESELARKNAPNRAVCVRRVLFRGITGAKDAQKQRGRNGEIDSEVCDAIGQLCALGLLDGHGYDAVDLRDKGRFWGAHVARTYKPSGCKTGSYERRDRSEPSIATTPDDLMFERIDANLWDGCIATFERKVLWTLVVDPLIGFGETVPWAQSLIDEALLQRGRIPQAMVFPSANDRELLKASVRALLVLAEGSLRPRWAA